MDGVEEEDSGGESKDVEEGFQLGTPPQQRTDTNNNNNNQIRVSIVVWESSQNQFG